MWEKPKQDPVDAEMEKYIASLGFAEKTKFNMNPMAKNKKRQEITERLAKEAQNQGAKAPQKSGSRRMGQLEDSEIHSEGTNLFVVVFLLLLVTGTCYVYYV